MSPTAPLTNERDVIVYKAKLAEQAERYDEMAESMKELVRTAAKDTPLTVEERNLLSVAFKNAVGARRASLRIINSLENKQRQRAQLEYVEITKAYQQKVTEELSTICEDIIQLLQEHLLQSVEEDVEAQVFYWKMKGDYYRYLCEFAGEANKAKATEAAKEAYERATDIAAKELNATHPVRLGLALNYSVFHYEILSHPEIACQIAKSAFDDAISQLESVDEESYRDSTLIMQLLRDNLTLWTTDAETAAAAVAPAAPVAVEPEAEK
ncbi:14-3-3 protein epsilon [Gregarina niphandrodes]|uniref:14-3-3 protein epsilon n=1 Tax=Gregarina niphandrodes TaxID=110365 RepID=A0A023B7P0_GRENI|nr:14-3-3 protein epsilon [Gregarina niphandrodes]EZG67545.1 14-3-3 protein epsilon [Gregarina niphandrodes]|eukprot:XP_011130206.1 14-3-3 protein epsilon [Gregarina niphandrodes]